MTHIREHPGTARIRFAALLSLLCVMFSVLPAQNATGNWVKVTQRVPVRIVLDEASPRPLISGLSTHVTVYTDGRKP